MEMLFPATPPRVSRSSLLGGKEVILIGGAQFEDGNRRLLVGSDVSDESMEALELALREIENLDATVRWVNAYYAGVIVPDSTVSDHVDGSPDANS